MPHSPSLLTSTATIPSQLPAAYVKNDRFFTPLFSAASESFFSQLLCFHDHLRCPLVFLNPFTIRSLGEGLLQDAATAAIPFCSGPRAMKRNLCLSLGRGILFPEDSSTRMILRARSIFFHALIVSAIACTAAWAQAPATTKKPPSSPNAPVPGAAPNAPQSKHFPI